MASLPVLPNEFFGFLDFLRIQEIQDGGAHLSKKEEYLGHCDIG